MSNSDASTSATDFIVIGSGVYGSSTALKLIRLGYSVTVLDRSKDGFASPDAASNDLNKIIRADYQDQHYSDLAKKAISKWRRDPIYSPFYHEVGLLLRSGLIPPSPTPSSSSSSSEKTREDSKSYVSKGVLRAISSNPSSRNLELPKEGSNLPKLAHEIQNKVEALNCFPKESRDSLGEVIEGYGNGNINEREQQFAYLNPRAGWAEASNATRSTLNHAIQLGVKVFGDSEIEELIFDKDEDKDQNEGKKLIKGIKTSKGSKFYLKDSSKGKIILCCGSWSKEILSKLSTRKQQKEMISVEKKISKVSTPSAQCVITLKIPKELRSKFKHTPVVLNFRTGFYLFEPNVHGIMKIAIHGEGYSLPIPPSGVKSDQIKPPSFYSSSSSSSTSLSSKTTSTPTSNNSSIPSNKISSMLSELYEIYPVLKNLPIESSRICWYSDSRDENWIIDFHPSFKNLLVCTGDSGHGFKFLPVLGDLIVGRLGLRSRESDYAVKGEELEELTEHQKRVFSFDHHFDMIDKEEVEMADSGRAKGGKEGDEQDNLRARL